MQAKQIVAFVMNELTDYSFEISMGARSILAAHGYQCIAVTGKHLDDPSSRAHNLIYQAIAGQQFAGALVHTFTLENHSPPTRLPQLLASLPNLSAVSIGSKLANYSSVIADQDMGMTSLMQHLLTAVGHKRLIFVRGLPTNVDSMRRELIFRHSLRQHGLLDQAKFITGYFDGDVVYKEVYASLLELTRPTDDLPSATFLSGTSLSGLPPIAIVCANDRMAVAAVEAAHDAGLRVPADVAVTGFDNSLECEKSPVPLTTIAQPLCSMGEQAAQMLLDLLAGKHVADRLVPTELIVRASSGDETTPGKLIGLPSDHTTGPAMTGAYPARKPSQLKHRGYLSHLLTNLNIKLMEKHTASDLKRELLSLFPRLGIQRCFLVLYDEPQSQFDAPARLFMAYDASDPTLADSFPTAPFASLDLLPALQQVNDADESMYELTPLVVGAENYGYMLFRWTTYYFIDFLTLPVIISGALRNIHQLQSLQEYALSLEQKVEERTRELRLINRRLQHEVHVRRKSELALRAANEKLQQLASIDGLTQLDNRTTLDAYLLEQCQIHTRVNTPLSVLLSDIDYFKNYNDTYGHQAGDDCLRAVAQVFKEIAGREGGLAARYGGEEFALVLPQCGEHEAMALAEQLMASIAKLQITHAASAVAAYITLSIGLATTSALNPKSTEELIAHADLALYAAKFRGRNCVTTYTEGMMPLRSLGHRRPPLSPVPVAKEITAVGSPIAI